MIRAFDKTYAYPEFNSEFGELPDNSILFLSDARGIYIPQNFAESVDRENVANVGDWAWTAIKAGPDDESYWDAWVEICDNAVVRTKDGKNAYAIWQDGDCWLIPLTERAS